MASSEEAKMTGTTPAWFTFTGMNVDAPPPCPSELARRPLIRLAYWTGMRRCPCSMRTMSVATAMITSTAVAA